MGEPKSNWGTVKSFSLFWISVFFLLDKFDSIGDRLSVRRDLFRQPSASSGMVGRLSTLGPILFQDAVVGF